jgi:hypothetical protein
MTPEQAKQLMELMTETFRNEREEMMKPILERMGQIAMHVGNLARLLQQNRRDFNATEAMKTILTERLKDVPAEEAAEHPLGKASPAVIAHIAYQLATEMERRGVAADAMAVQSQQSAAKSPPSRATPGDAAAQIFQGAKKADPDGNAN